MLFHKYDLSKETSRNYTDASVFAFYLTSLEICTQMGVGSGKIFLREKLKFAR